MLLCVWFRSHLGGRVVSFGKYFFLKDSKILTTTSSRFSVRFYTACPTDLVACTVIVRNAGPGFRKGAPGGADAGAQAAGRPRAARLLRESSVGRGCSVSFPRAFYNLFNITRAFVLFADSLTDGFVFSIITI